MARRGQCQPMPRADVLLVSLGGTAGLREADAELAASLRRAGAEVAEVHAARVREWRTYALIELAWARSARAAAQAGIAEHRPRAVLYSSTTAALLAPAPGAIRFDAPAAGNRPGRHGIWQRPVERRRLASAPLLVPWSEGGLAEAPQPRADALVVPVPVAPSGPARRRARHRRHHLRREPGEEGPRPRPRRLGGRAAAGRGAGGGRAGRARRREGVRFTGMLAARGVPGAAAPRARVRLRARGARTTGSPSSRRWPTAACSSPRRRRARTRRCRVARALDPRLVSAASPAALRIGARRPAPGYAERALEALAPWRPEAVDRVVAEQLLPRLQSLA